MRTWFPHKILFNDGCGKRIQFAAFQRQSENNTKRCSRAFYELWLRSGQRRSKLHREQNEWIRRQIPEKHRSKACWILSFIRSMRSFYFVQIFFSCFISFIVRLFCAVKNLYFHKKIHRAFCERKSGGKNHHRRRAIDENSYTLSQHVFKNRWRTFLNSFPFFSIEKRQMRAAATNSQKNKRLWKQVPTTNFT